MIVNSVRHSVLRISLTVTVIVDDQISCKPHKPIRKVTLFRIVLIQRPVNTDKDFLCQIFGRLYARGKTISKVKDPPRKRRYNLFPRRAVARTSTADEFRSVNIS
jgi:hypothetical protein